MPPVIDTRQALDFERPIVELENKIAELKQLGGPQLELEIRRLERKARQLQREVFAELSAWQKVQLSRHPLRPYTLDYVGAPRRGLRRAARRSRLPRRRGDRRRRRPLPRPRRS